MKWQLMPVINPELVSGFPEIDGVILQLLYNRNLITQEAIDNFLNPNFEEQLLDPYLFTDMEKAVRRLFEAIKNGGKIMVYGDYDADGVCSTTIIYETIRGLGGEAEIYIPFRDTEGYGLNKKVAQQIIDQKFNLLITVDCGVANVEEVKMFQDNGIDVIILDHHEEPLELPKPFALINPNVKICGYPESRLCGAGVAFKFVQALVRWQETQDSAIKLPAGFEKWLLDLVAIATVGDIVPLLKENRILVKYGLVVLEKTRNLGVRKIMELVNYRNGKIDTEYIGWRLVPRINAAGRVNHASAAFYLLTAKDEAEAGKWVSMLEENNKHRQQLTEKILVEAEKQVADIKESDRAIVIYGEQWPTGVLGLAAGRLADKYHRPTLVFSKESDKYVASGRSIEEFDITAALKQCDQLLERYGGHPQACGLTIIGETNFLAFKNQFSVLAEQSLAGVELVKSLAVEAELSLEQVNWQLFDNLEKFEPFGEANERPLFLIKNLRIEQISTVGADGKHLKVLVSQDDKLNNVHKLIGFSFGDWCARLKIGDLIDIVFELGVNEWNGNRELQLKIIDLKISSPR